MAYNARICVQEKTLIKYPLVIHGRLSLVGVGATSVMVDEVSE